MYSVEWQKRGLPHTHISFWLHDKITSNEIDDVFSAKIPDENVDEGLYDIVVENMIHGPCGALNEKLPCMAEGRCTKQYPRILVPNTITGNDGYPQYKRRSSEDGGKIAMIKKHNSTTIEVDNKYLRPETAQGIFVNFSRLLEFNNGRLPFAAAQIGPAFRNEISPRSGLLRVREFTMAEIEHFCDPNDKSHPKFNSVKDLEILLYSACAQMEGKPSKLMKLGDAVTQKLIDNETLGYFIGRIYQFLIMVGVNGKKLRFRQHMSNEMAHYARDCWDAECLTSFGWVECVGCADRSAFDLTQHSKATGAKLKAERKLSEARIEEVVDVLPRKALIAKQFKAEVKIVLEEIEKVDSNIIESSIKQEGKFDLQVNDKSYSITSEMVEVRRQMKKVHVENFVPSVIEPSFGIGRILYVILEHNFGVREGDEKRTFLKLPPIVAPYKCCVLPLSNKPDFMPFVKQISQDLEDQEIPSEVNTSSGSVGRRYARTDELGVPFAVTVDFDTLKEPHSVTLRDRDSMLQVRLPVNEVAAVIKSLSCGKLSWSEVRAKYPAFIQQE
ncbi:LOW QUALITY PROTEIN: glycine--tRNA ligase-like [Artemia franciscana]|uniref:LOW QUALITY PROTEIN: glycine--tRNA ligase-like n=1 Tax=Artemia franciscana TaxID=6661 RepID=UPI0032DAD5D0